MINKSKSETQLDQILFYLSDIVFRQLKLYHLNKTLLNLVVADFYLLPVFEKHSVDGPLKDPEVMAANINTFHIT